MATLRELKGRIGSVGSSEKITGAMKMISSAKMHKAEGILRRPVALPRLCAGHYRQFAQQRRRRKFAPYRRAPGRGACHGRSPRQRRRTMRRIQCEYLQGPAFYNRPSAPGVWRRCRHRPRAVGKKLAKSVVKLAASDPRLTCTEIAGVDSKSDGEAFKKFCRNFARRASSTATRPCRTALCAFLLGRSSASCRRRLSAHQRLKAQHPGQRRGVGLISSSLMLPRYSARCCRCSCCRRCRSFLPRTVPANRLRA